MWFVTPSSISSLSRASGGLDVVRLSCENRAGRRGVYVGYGISLHGQACRRDSAAGPAEPVPENPVCQFHLTAVGGL
jgi:hypothetical protein